MSNKVPFKVRCNYINNTYRGTVLNLGKIYTVIQIYKDTGFYVLRECTEKSYPPDLFEVIREDRWAPGTLVLCIEENPRHGIKLNHIYEVESDEEGGDCPMIYIKGGSTGHFKRRFKLYENELAIKPQVSQKSFDLSDWQTWAKPLTPGNCKCDIPKKDCPYHFDT